MEKRSKTTATAKKLPAFFYRTAAGAEPVRDWLKDLSAIDRRILGFDIAAAEFGWPVGMPVYKSLGDGLCEIRSNLTQSRIARVMFCVADKKMLLLHGFIKKSQKTSITDLALARKRQREAQA